MPATSSAAALLLQLVARWSAAEVPATTAAEACEFDRVDGRTLSADEVARAARPLVFTGLTEGWPARAKWPTAAAFASLHGGAPGYARDHDHLELRDVDLTVAEYLDGSFRQGGANLSRSAALFVNDYEDARLLDRLRDDYAAPSALAALEVLRVLALERSWAGVAFHRHEVSWQALLAGRKAWFLAPPSAQAVPQHEPCAFLSDGPPPEAQRCTLAAGEVLLVPEGWWHATCSLPKEPTLAVGGVGSLADWPDLLLAARRGHAEHLRAARGGVEAEVPRGSHGVFTGGERPLFVAAAFGHLPAVEALLENKAAVGARRGDGRTAVHEAARRGDLGVLQALHRADGNLTDGDAGGSTALHHGCAERGNVEVVEFLLSHGASAATKRLDGRMPLHVACRSHANPVPLLRALLQQGSVSASPLDARGRTPLMHCAAAGNAQGVGLLLRFGGSEAARAVDRDGSDALNHALTGRGDAGCVQRLLAAGLPAEGRLPAAARLGEPEVLPLLVGAGASLAGALLEATKAGHARVVRTLVGDLGADVEEVEAETGATPLHLAALAGHMAAAHALLEVRADAARADGDGLTPLHYAAAGAGSAAPRPRQELLEALAGRAGEQAWQLRSAGGLTPLHLAAAAGDAELARWLVVERQVADPLAADGNGASPADAAEQAGHQAGHQGLARLLRRWGKRGAEEL